MNRPNGIGDAWTLLLQLGELNRPFRSRELSECRLPRAWLQFTGISGLERLACGTYGRRGRGYSRICVATRRVDRGFACLSSALWLHGLIPDEPADAWVCIRHKAWKPLASSTPNTQFVRTSRWPVLEDLCLLSRWNVPTTAMARTVVDFFRFRHRVGLPAAHKAFELVVGSGRCTAAEIEACADRYQLRRWRPPTH